MGTDALCRAASTSQTVTRDSVQVSEMPGARSLQQNAPVDLRDTYGPGNVCCISQDASDDFEFSVRPLAMCQPSQAPVPQPFQWPNFEAENGCVRPPTGTDLSLPVCCVSFVADRALVTQESARECLQRPNSRAEIWSVVPVCIPRELAAGNINGLAAPFNRNPYGVPSLELERTELLDQHPLDTVHCEQPRPTCVCCVAGRVDDATWLFVFTAIAVCFLVLFTCLYFGAVLLFRAVRGRDANREENAGAWIGRLDISPTPSVAAESVDISTLQNVDEEGNPVVLVVSPDESMHVGVVHGGKPTPSNGAEAKIKYAAQAANGELPVMPPRQPMGSFPPRQPINGELAGNGDAQRASCEATRPSAQTVPTGQPGSERTAGTVAGAADSSAPLRASNSTRRPAEVEMVSARADTATHCGASASNCGDGQDGEAHEDEQP